jgi:SAM (Sterile alpha motif) domain-containing protein
MPDIASWLSRLGLDKCTDTFIAHEIDRDALRARIDHKTVGIMPRWLETQTSHRPVWAIGFVVNRQNQLYVGKPTMDEVADVLSKGWASFGLLRRVSVRHGNPP